MRSSKKFLAMMLSLIMAMGVLTTTAFSAEFDDVPQNHFARTAINRLVDMGVVVGMDARTFAPEATVTRAQFARMINLSFGFTEKGTANFSDVPEDAWYAEDIAKASAAGYLSGFDGKADPNGYIDRQSAASIAHRVYRLKGLLGGATDSTTEFSDISSAASWAREGIQAMAARGIINGFPEGTFRPTEKLTRAQAAVLIINMLDKRPVAEEEVMVAVSGLKAEEVKKVENIATFRPSIRGNKETSKRQVELTGIKVTPPIELFYLVGENLDLTGMVVTGTYSDGSKTIISHSDCKLSGYDKTTAAALTVNVSYGGKSGKFDVEVFPTVTNGELVNIIYPDTVTVPNGVGKTATGLRLPPRVQIIVYDNEQEKEVTTLAKVVWNVEGSEYIPSEKYIQGFYVSGKIELPDGINNENALASETVEIFVIVLRKPVKISETITGVDSRFAPNYPAISIDEYGIATVSLKLKPGIATSEKPVIVYYATDAYITENSTFDKESILAGHVIEKYYEYEWLYSASGWVDEVIINGDGEESFMCWLPMFSGWTDAIGIVLLANDDINDPLATAATVIYVSNDDNEQEEDWDDEDMYPDSGGAVFNTDGDTIFAYFNMRITNKDLNKDDFNLTNAGDVKIESITVDHHPDASYYWYYSSWVIVKLDNAVTIDQNKVVLTYTPGTTNVITGYNYKQANKDIIWGNPEEVWGHIIPGNQYIEAYINPSKGTLRVDLYPGIKENWDAADSPVFLIKGSDEVKLTLVETWHNINSSTQLFTFAKDTGKYTSKDDYDYRVGIKAKSGMTTFAHSEYEPIDADKIKKENIMELPTKENVKASFKVDVWNDEDGNSYEYGLSITVKLPTDTVLSSGAFGCSFKLEVDKKPVLVRNYAYFDGDTVTIYLNERRANIVLKGINEGKKVTIEYDPDAGGHYPRLYNWLSDISGALVPGFGPVTVEKIY